ncbi:MAG: hypothetical protein H2069_08600 [Legionella sp.]|nr:hypothetical protein [Legionella sp.]
MFRSLRGFIQRHRSALFTLIYFGAVALIGGINWSVGNGVLLEGLAAVSIVLHDIVKDWFFNTFAPLSTPLARLSLSTPGNMRIFTPFQMIFPDEIQVNVEIRQIIQEGEALRARPTSPPLSHGLTDEDITGLFKAAPKTTITFETIQETANVFQSKDPQLKQLIKEYETLQANLKKSCAISLESLPSPANINRGEWCLLIDKDHPMYAAPYKTEDLKEWLKTNGINPMNRQAIIEKEDGCLTPKFYIEPLTRAKHQGKFFINCEYLQALLKKINDRIKILLVRDKAKAETPINALNSYPRGSFFEKNKSTRPSQKNGAGRQETFRR